MSLRKRYFVSVSCSHEDWVAYSARCVEMLKAGGTIEISFEHWTKTWYKKLYEAYGGWKVQLFPITKPGMQMKALVSPERIRTSTSNVLMEVKGLAAEFNEERLGSEDEKAPLQAELEKKIESGEWKYEKVEPLNKDLSGRKDYKVCRICGEELPLSSYYTQQRADGTRAVSSYCKECKKEREKERRRKIRACKAQSEEW